MPPAQFLYDSIETIELLAQMRDGLPSTTGWQPCGPQSSQSQQSSFSSYSSGSIYQIDLMESLNELYDKSDRLLLELSAYLKKASQEDRSNDNLTVEQRKILKLFNYQSWSEYMLWVEDKLHENGDQIIQGQKLSEIVEEELEESMMGDSRTHELKINEQSLRCEILAMKNGKLRRENIILQNKIEEIRKKIKQSSSRYLTENQSRNQKQK